jgi:putative peptidoglycan lipid II flippase
MASQHFANQIGTVNGFADRYFQSFLAAGSISSLGYASQILNNLSSLMTFREIYIVPLAPEAGRSERIERILKGVVLLSIPVSGFIVAFAQPIVEILFQRGQFNAEAAGLTSRVMAIMAIGLVASSIMAPLQRVFQITNRVAFTHVFYASWLAGIFVFQYLFIFVLKWEAVGYAIGSCINGFLLTALVAVLVRRCGVTIAWGRVLLYVVYAASVSAAAIGAAQLSTASYSALVRLLVAGPIYGSVVVAGYLVIHRRIRMIVGLS